MFDPDTFRAPWRKITNREMASATMESLYLECGHVVDHYAKTAPKKKVRCSVCLQAAAVPADCR